MNEAETRAEHIDPALKAAGWGVVPGSRIRREYPITVRLPVLKTTSSPQSGHLNGPCAFDAKYAVMISPVSFRLAQSMEETFAHFIMKDVSMCK